MVPSAPRLFDVLPHDTEDWKLVSALLGERETFKTEAKKTAGQERLLQNSWVVG